MQARAIFEAALDTAARTGEATTPEIMIPLVAMKEELTTLKARIDAVAAAVSAERGATLEYLVGTMIELPRAALIADALAQEAAFFSFGTNDLTQTTFGLSRDDSASFLPDYLRQNLLERDPFVTLDRTGVGALVQIAADRGRNIRPGIKLGICGEHGGDPDSIAFVEALGLDYVSCSPYRTPIARLAAAQASLRSTPAHHR
jgi:pyruvate,orthophosphate dikinase